MKRGTFAARAILAGLIVGAICVAPAHAEEVLNNVMIEESILRKDKQGRTVRTFKIAYTGEDGREAFRDLDNRAIGDKPDSFIGEEGDRLAEELESLSGTDQNGKIRITREANKHSSVTVPPDP